MFYVTADFINLEGNVQSTLSEHATADAAREHAESLACLGYVNITIYC